MNRHRIARVEDIGPGELKRVDVDGVAVCVAHVEGEGFHAISDTCTHEESSLSEGSLWGCQVECPMHGSLFDVRTGEVSGVPATIPAQVYKVEIEDDGVLVLIDR